MSFYRDKLKRLVVIGGIALAFMPCLQQTRLLCKLVGCEISTNAVVARGTNSDRCCGHKSESHRGEPSQSKGEHLPCGQYCWCCQPPAPRVAPRNITEFAQSHVSALNAEMPIKVGVERQLTCEEFLAPDSLLSLSAGETCVRLCRFLI